MMNINLHCLSMRLHLRFFRFRFENRKETGVEVVTLVDPVSIERRGGGGRVVEVKKVWVVWGKAQRKNVGEGRDGEAGPFY